MNNEGVEPCKLVIIDPCYHKLGGHHHSVNSSIIKYFNAFSPLIYADRSIRSTLSEKESIVTSCIRPHFSDLGYINPLSYEELKGFNECASRFTKALDDIEATTLVAHTLLHFHIFGLGLHLLRQRPKTVIVSLMFSPFEGLRPLPLESKDYSYTKIAIKSLDRAALEKAHDITIGITSEYHWRLTEDLRKECSFLRFVRSPWLVGAHNAFHNISKRDCNVTDKLSNQIKKVLLYLGDAKPDKGIERVRDFLKWLATNDKIEAIKALKDIQLEIRITYCDEWLQPCAKEIEELCASLPILVEFSSRHLEESEYFEVLSDADMIVWLYDEKNYRYRTSGIFYDALSLFASSLNDKDKYPLFVASSGSWMHHEFELLGFTPVTLDLQHPSWKTNLLNVISDLSSKSTVDHSLVNQDLITSYSGQSWNHWLALTAGIEEECLLYGLRECRAEFRPLIVISTMYPHFTNLSGPTGFVKFLGPHFHFKTRLGKTNDYEWLRRLTGLKSATDDALQVEMRLAELLKDFPADIICVDGEHSGSLLALALKDGKIHQDTRIVAWFHQPTAVLNQDIIDCDKFPSTHIKLVSISPCQNAFFRQHLAQVNTCTIPHGVHQRLIDIGGSRDAKKITADTISAQLSFLTVGNWLRDRAIIIEAALQFPEYKFIWVSTGMKLESHEQVAIDALPNLTIRSEGLSNSDLHECYINADFLFQPLISATANNAIMEAMAFGLPIITKDLESTRYYTGDNALFYKDLEDLLQILSDKHLLCKKADSLSTAVREKVRDYEWSLVSARFKSLLDHDYGHLEN